MASLYADEDFDEDKDALAARIDQAIAAAGPLSGQHVRVNRPPVP